MLDLTRLSERRGLRLAGPALRDVPAMRPVNSPLRNRLLAARRATGPWLLTGLLAAAISVVAGNEITALAAGCVVKGNISVVGERIYHVPGQDYYDQTTISWLKGERWFCSEAAARASGWRKALQ